MAKTAHNLKPLKTAFTERSLKKCQVDEDMSKETPSESSDLVSIRSSPTPPPALYVHWAQDLNVLTTSAHRDRVSDPNGTYKRWSEIKYCYIDSPVKWVSDDSENSSPKMKTPCVNTPND